jgi:hypothetical protein
MPSLSAIKSSSLKTRWNLRQVYKIVEYKQGCVYRTKSLGYIVCLPDYKFLNQTDIQLHPPSTKVSKELL